MIFKTRNFARWARKSGLAKDLLGLTAAQIAVALGEGSLVEVEHEACTT
jgi:hypothetical protein